MCVVNNANVDEFNARASIVFVAYALLSKATAQNSGSAYSVAAAERINILVKSNEGDTTEASPAKL